MDEDFRFGTAVQRPWRKAHIRSCGQELIPCFYREDVDKILDLMEAAIDMGRSAIFKRWGELAYPVGIPDLVWPVPIKV